MEQTRTYRHLSVALRRFLTMSDADLDGMLVSEGRPLTAAEARAALEELRSEGVTGLAGEGCDNYDPATGRCLGHKR